ncbi:hypothetical protein KFZ56_18350 [Virgibacillus sp. NKC19-3]|uniref:hypothetical protein n=1 Tax=Virgibacillus saliphilus TaxID=2831674 RepID=UPI001C9B3557|nr:hypothetical protein [Virgibacillus sp. NKC19-3]MBY7144981.1 hypothetical protein [Virgibacillus sp. NKC19-3]
MGAEKVYLTLQKDDFELARFMNTKVAEKKTHPGNEVPFRAEIQKKGHSFG